MLFRKKYQAQADAREETQSTRTGTPANVNKDVTQFFRVVKDFQQDRITQAIRSRKIAWVIAGISIGVAALGVGAVAALSPLKTAVPYVIRVDNNTGFTDVATPVNYSGKSYGEALDKYWLSTYVVHHESYDWSTIQSDYNAVGLMSDDKVFGAYSAANTADTSPLKVLGKTLKVKVHILNVTFVDDIAQIRYTKSVVDSNDMLAAGHMTTRWLATVTYDFKKKILFTKDQVNTNPLGFQVTSWRSDPESVATPVR